MKKCEHNCTPNCTFCFYSRHGKMAMDGTDGAIGCTKHLDEEHQVIAINNGSCEDFHCYEAEN